jgi:serine/threonine-protein kinase
MVLLTPRQRHIDCFGKASTMADHLVELASEQGCYRLGAQLGSGTWCDTYEAVDARTHTPVVAQLFHPVLTRDAAFRERLLGILAAVAPLRHPALVAVLGFGTAAGSRVWKVQERVLGRSLLAWTTEGRLPPARGIEVVTALADALAAAHDRGLVHGGPHPGVVRIAGTAAAPRPKLSDLGHAVADRAAAGPRLSGTVSFHHEAWAPEVRAGREPTAASDVYGLGSLLRTCLSAGGAPPAPELAAELAAVTRRAMAPEPGDRFATAAAMKAALERVRHEHSRV